MRKKQTVDELKKQFPITTANDIPKPFGNAPNEKQVIEQSVKEEYGHRLIALAKAKKCHVEDLFVWVEENYGKRQKVAEIKENKAKTIIQDERPTRSNFMTDLRKKKLGL